MSTGVEGMAVDDVEMMAALPELFSLEVCRRPCVWKLLIVNCSEIRLWKAFIGKAAGFEGAFCHVEGSVASFFFFFLPKIVGTLCDDVLLCWSRACVCCLRAGIANFSNVVWWACFILFFFFFLECISIALLCRRSHGCLCCFRFAVACFVTSRRCNSKLPFWSFVSLLCTVWCTPKLLSDSFQHVFLRWYSLA